MRAFVQNRGRRICSAAASSYVGSTSQLRAVTTTSASDNSTFSPEELAGFADIPPAPPKSASSAVPENEHWGDDDGNGWANEPLTEKPVEGFSQADEAGWNSNSSPGTSAGGRWGSSANTNATSRWGKSEGNVTSPEGNATSSWDTSNWGNQQEEGDAPVDASLEDTTRNFTAPTESDDLAEDIVDVYGDEDVGVSSDTTGPALTAALASTVAATGGSAALTAAAINNKKAKQAMESSKNQEKSTTARGDAEPETMDETEQEGSSADGDSTSATKIVKRKDVPTIGPQSTKGSVSGPIDVSAKYNPRLATLPRAPVEAVMALQPQDAVELAADYVHMQHFIRSCRRRKHSIVNPIYLSSIKEEALLSAAIKAIEAKAVPIEKAAHILDSPFLFERLKRYRKYLATLIRGWAVEVILADKLEPKIARKLLRISNHFGRDARVIGSLAQKSIVDLSELSNRAIISIMYGVADTYVKPPPSFWSILLRQIAKNLNESKATAESASSTNDNDAVATTESKKRDPKSLNPRDVYRILDVCARVGVYSDLNMLAQISEHAWRQISDRAAAANFPDKPIVRNVVAVRRLHRVAEIGPQQFFRLIQLSSTLGTNFKAGQGVITDKILIPLSFHLNDHHTSEYIEAISMSKTRYAPAIQAIIDRVVFRGTKSPASLMHVSRILRSISHHNDVCAQLRLAKFFDLLENLCSHQQVLRTVQMTRLIEDIYYITRRFSRTAPIVVRMQKLVEGFAGALIPALKKGVAAIDQINSVLEHTVMMGMSKDAEKFPNVRKLRDLRKEIYANTKPGAFPAGYKDKCDPSVRFLYNDLIYVNQSQVLFQQQVDRPALIQLQQLIAAAGAYNVLHAIFIYNELHGATLPLSPFLQGLLMKYFKHTMREVKTGQTIQEISRHLRYPREKVLTTKDLLFFASAVKRKSLTNLKSQTFYLEFLNAASVALGGNETVQAQVHALQSSALY